VDKAAPTSSKKRRGRKTRLAPIDASKVLDLDGHLIEAYREAVAAAIPADVKVSEPFWEALRIRIGLFLQIHDRRLRAPLSRRRWERISRLVEELGTEMRIERRATPWAYYDPLWPNRALAGLWEIKTKADAYMGYFQIAAEAFSRGHDPHREYLYQSVLDLWWANLGQWIGYSTAADTYHRGGPLVRFFRACVEPLLGELSDETIRSAIRRRWGAPKGI
jgi:hypothetical protein